MTMYTLSTHRLITQNYPMHTPQVDAAGEKWTQERLDDVFAFQKGDELLMSFNSRTGQIAWRKERQGVRP
jgi:hypothetical protein